VISLSILILLSYSYIVTTFSAKLESIPTSISLPLQWQLVPINNQVADTCISNLNQTSWIMGGQAIGVDNDLSNTVKHVQLINSTYVTMQSDMTLLVPGIFPGQYLSAHGFYCDAPQTALNAYNNGTQKMCFVGANDGYSNSPICGCCLIDSSSNIGSVKCNDLDNICPPIFSSCVINDMQNQRAIQIGGSTGVNTVTNILCFNVSTEQYTTSVNTIPLLQAETSFLDPYCGYANLANPASNVGCDLMLGTSQNILVVGGRDIVNFLNTIQLCSPHYQNCVVQSLYLPQPTSNMKVIALSDCAFITFGGQTQSGILGQIYIGDICSQQWLYKQSMPALISDFSIAIGQNLLCLYGGIINNKLQNVAYCTSYNP